jgi:hypothetical protein
MHVARQETEKFKREYADRGRDHPSDGFALTARARALISTISAWRHLSPRT